MDSRSFLNAYTSHKLQHQIRCEGYHGARTESYSGAAAFEAAVIPRVSGTLQELEITAHVGKKEVKGRE